MMSTLFLFSSTSYKRSVYIFLCRVQLQLIDFFFGMGVEKLVTRLKALVWILLDVRIERGSSMLLPQR